jgi:hemolysin III
MTSTRPLGASRRVNRAILTATVAFSGGALVALSALLLVLRDPRDVVVSSLVYGLCLILCSLSSYLYNMLETATRRGLLRYLDHAAIFLLIAGTYTPFAAGVRGPFGIGLLEWVWGLSLLGIALKLLLHGRYDQVFVGLYLAVGWLFVFAIDQILRVVAPSSLVFLALGGVAYTVGALIYARDIGRWTDPVWHACVLAGSFSHFIAVALRVAAQA